MEDMISEMQEEQAFEQELKDKGLRNIIGTMPKGGGGRRNIVTQPHTSRVSRTQTEPQPQPKSRPTRRTKKTQTSESESEVEEEQKSPARQVDPDVNDTDDFSDFSL